MTDQRLDETAVRLRIPAHVLSWQEVLLVIRFTSWKECWTDDRFKGCPTSRNFSKTFKARHEVNDLRLIREKRMKGRVFVWQSNVQASIDFQCLAYSFGIASHLVLSTTSIRQHDMIAEQRTSTLT